ncbi:unnamed protein product [Heterobilharzia americana]|nr:unnamed protein product [Heterobilharzia americana]
MQCFPLFSRNSSGQKEMPKTVSKAYEKLGDQMHFYLMLGLVPVLLLAFLVNVFVGPAELTDIPEDYEPRHWEYHKHPITRFIAKYLHMHPQKVYETTVGCYEEIRAAKKAKRTFMLNQDTALSDHYYPILTT